MIEQDRYLMHKIIIFSYVVLLFTFQSVAFGDNVESTPLEDLFPGTKQTRIEYGDDAVIIVNQTVKKLEFQVGEMITVKPYLVNVGNKNVTITHSMPLFLTEIKHQNGSAVWPPYDTGIVPIPVQKILQPNVPLGGELGIQKDWPIILNSTGKYSITSIAYFKASDDYDKGESFHVIWSEPLEIILVSEYSTDSNLLSPLKQFRSGVSLDDIHCKENLVLIMKSSTDSPACVTPDTKQKLIERGWAKA